MSDTNIFWLNEDSKIFWTPYNCTEFEELVSGVLRPISFGEIASLFGLNYSPMAAALVDFTLASALLKSATQITLEQLISDPSSFDLINGNSPIRLTISDHGIDLVMMAINSSDGVVYVIIYSRPI